MRPTSSKGKATVLTLALVLPTALLALQLLVPGSLHDVALSAAEIAANARLTLSASCLRWVATRVFTMKSFCGNAYFQDDLRVVVVDAKVARLTAGRRAALTLLLPHVGGNVFADSSNVDDLALKTLREEYTEEELRRITEEAIASLKPTDHSLTLLGVDIPIHHHGCVPTPTTVTEHVRRIRFFARALGTNVEFSHP